MSHRSTDYAPFTPRRRASAATGTAVTRLRLKSTDPVGTYQVRSNASANGIVGRATRSFTVQ